MTDAVGAAGRGEIGTRAAATLRLGLVRSLAVPASLYVAALAVYAWAAGLVGFAVNEGSAYYVAAARSIATGRGLSVDAIWSYSTPPLVLPRPAFELWQPMASFVAAVPMTVLGPSLHAAQLGMAALAALLAPLAWLVARDAAAALQVAPHRAQVLAVGAGVLIALTGPIVTAVALPDSTIPFAVAATACCWLVGRASRPDTSSRTMLWFLLGIALGVAWLARHEAVWLALAAMAVAVASKTLTLRQLVAACAGGLLVTAPWLARNMLAFGTPLPGQALDNALLVANEQIFAYLDRPSLAAFLAQGPALIAANVVEAIRHNLIDVLVVPAAPLTLAGLAGALFLVRRVPEVRTTSLGTLLIVGLITFVATTILFPIASLWGTFEHAAGPLFVAFAVAGVLAFDRALQAVGRWRGWRRSNAWLAPLALSLVLVPLTALQLTGLAVQAEARADDNQRLAAAVLAQPEVREDRRVVISDRPIWLSDATGLPAIALPAEPLDSLTALVKRFDAALVVVSDNRGGYPGLLRSADGLRCFSERPAMPSQPDGTAIFAIREGCR